MRPGGIARLNAARTECKAGHPFAGENLRIDRRGHRICVACNRARWTAGNAKTTARMAPIREAARAEKALDRFFALTQVPSLLEWWLWTATLSGDGYGRFMVQGVRQGSHRHAYELAIGPIPEGLEIDHLCRVRHCVNPLHLEPVTREENSRRTANTTHCRSGSHEWTPENIRDYYGSRFCNPCRNESARARWRDRNVERKMERAE